MNTKWYECNVNYVQTDRERNGMRLWIYGNWKGEYCKCFMNGQCDVEGRDGKFGTSSFFLIFNAEFHENIIWISSKIGLSFNCFCHCWATVNQLSQRLSSSGFYWAVTNFMQPSLKLNKTLTPDTQKTSFPTLKPPLLSPDHPNISLPLLQFYCDIKQKFLKSMWM